MAAAEQHPQGEGYPSSSTEQLAVGQASKLNACSGTQRTEAAAAVQGPSAVALATAAAVAAGGSACEQARNLGRVAGSALDGTGSTCMTAGSALDGTDAAAMAASSALDGTGPTAKAAGKAAEPVGRAAQAAGCSRKPAAPVAQKRKATQAGHTGAALTGPQKRARLRGQAAVALRSLEQARQRQQVEHAAGAVKLMHLESLRLQGQRRLQWQARRAHAGQTLHRRSRCKDPARPQQAQPSAQPLRKRSNQDVPARPVPPGSQRLASPPQRAEGAVAGGGREQQGAMAGGGAPGPGRLLAGNTAPQLWGAAHESVTHAGAMQPPKQAAFPGGAAVPTAAPRALCQRGSMRAGGCCPHNSDCVSTVRVPSCSWQPESSSAADLRKATQHLHTGCKLMCIAIPCSAACLLQAACCMLRLMLPERHMPGPSAVHMYGQARSPCSPNSEVHPVHACHWPTSAITSCQRYDGLLAIELCSLLPQGPSHCQDHHWCHHLCHQAARGSTGRPKLWYSMLWSGRPHIGCSHRCRSMSAHLLSLCCTWAFLCRAAAPHLRWAPPAVGTKAMLAGPWRQSRCGREPCLLLGAQEQACSRRCRHRCPPHRHHPWVSLAAGCRRSFCLGLRTLPQLGEERLTACLQQAGVCHSQRRAQDLCLLPHPAGPVLQVKHTRFQDGSRCLFHWRHLNARHHMGL